ncbi:pectinesterase inhibitor 4-like [Malania oleifera]|uniref:pectinesterase inhibitor 4-like n=1 Tax=Malania oleifera TaxID=397392 RepID=UPI0025AEC64A|nr:pectinesterase inhibitor 4-like [Malania oleifera]
MKSIFLLLPLTFFLALHPNLAVAVEFDASDTVTATANGAYAPADATSLIVKACEHSVDKELCHRTLETHPNGNHADLTSLATIALKHAVENASNALIRINKLLNETGLDPVVDQCLQDCLEHYLDAVDQLDGSIAALASKAHHDVKTWVKAAIADADSCDAAFHEQGSETLVLAHTNRVFRKLCNNVLAITNQLG